MSDEHLCRTGDANHFCVCSMGRDHDSMLCRSDDERLPRPVSASPVDTKSADPLPWLGTYTAAPTQEGND